MTLETKRLDDYRIKLLKSGEMKTEALIYATDKIKIESEALQQLQNATYVDDEAKIFATPDIHKGYGVPIGSIFASPNYISPSAVGYDINCGMRLITTGIPIDKVDIKKIANSIRNCIPLGEGKKNISLDDKTFIHLLKKGVMGIEEISSHSQISSIFNLDEWQDDLKRIEENGSINGGNLTKNLESAINRGKVQLGTLGGGNHFIELQVVVDIFNDEIASRWNIKKGDLTIMIHSGSRGFGHEIAGHYMKNSLIYCEKNKLKLYDRQFSYFPIKNPEGQEYLDSMILAGNFAYINRQIMTMLVRKNIKNLYPDLKMPLLFDISHNFIKEEIYNNKKYYVHRKGATRAFDKQRMNNTLFQNTGQPVLIPGSMGTSSYLLCGTESGIESFFSVNHGAGRVMGRMQAAGKISKKGKIIREGLISDEEFKKEMEGIYLISEDKFSIKEEAPGAYKNIDEIIEAVTGAKLAKKVARFKPLAVLKG